MALVTTLSIIVAGLVPDMTASLIVDLRVFRTVAQGGPSAPAAARAAGGR